MVPFVQLRLFIVSLLLNITISSCDKIKAELLNRLLKADDTPRRNIPVTESSLFDDLIENPNASHDPPVTDVQLLRELLGSAYDPEFMSITGPSQTPTKILIVNGRPKGFRPKYLNSLRSTALQDGTNIKLKIGKRNLKKVQDYVWSLTYCPVLSVWKHLGIRFWPRWIKEGRCSQKRSCSIPEGMQCKTSSTTMKTILRWHCLDFVSKNGCGWIHVQFPVITECSCSC